MQQLILMLHVIVSISLVVLILIQHGKGADIGAAFGSGGANTMFGAAGSTPFLVKVTATLAATFFCTSLALSYFVAKRGGHTDVLSQITQPQSVVQVKEAAKKEVPKEPAANKTSKKTPQTPN